MDENGTLETEIGTAYKSVLATKATATEPYVARTEFTRLLRDKSHDGMVYSAKVYQAGSVVRAT